MRRIWGLVLATAAVIAAGCASVEPDELVDRHRLAVDGVPSPADTGPHPEPEVFSDEYWAHLDLPMVFSDVRVVGSVALFEVVEDRQTSLIGLDVTSGQVLYRYPVHPHHRLRGVASSLLVSEDHAVVVRVDVTDNAGRPDARIHGHDIATGEPLWSVWTGGEGYPPFDCGDSFCMRTSGRQVRYDYETGAVIDTAPIAGDGFYYVVLDNGFLLSETHDAFVGSADYGMGASWRLPFEEVGAGFDRVSADRHDGWGVVFDGAAGAVHWSVGDTTLRAGFDIRSGDVLWSKIIPFPTCHYDDDTVVLECWSQGSSVEVRRRDIATGDVVWSTARVNVDAPVLNTADGLVQLASRTDDLGASFFALDDGRSLNDPGYRLCPVTAGWTPVFIPWLAPVAWEWVGRLHPAVCDDEWTYQWIYDLAVSDTTLAESLLIDATDGWQVGVDSDGLIVGLRTG